MAGPFERGNVPSGSIKCRGFPEWLLASQEGLCPLELVSYLASGVF
jgi:hypothetical protein